MQIMGFPDNIILEWNSIKDWKVTYTSEVPSEKFVYINSIRLRKLDKNLVIYGYIKHNPINDVIPKHMKKIRNKALLKSNLQKCIRRGDIDRTLVTSANLILIDLLSFLRRIIIISIEDVCVTNNIGLLVWLMIAYPNYEITNEIIQYLLLTVYTLCTHSKKYIPEKDEVLRYDKINYNNTIINSLLVREEFGGMKCDMALIRQIINSKNTNIIRVKIGDLKITRNITKSDILKESVDFHCFPNMVEIISKETGIKSDTIKRLIWENNSKYNFREKSGIVEPYLWEKIKDCLSRYQLNIKYNLVIF
tara:strand:+ start:225 stop:1142 length:918 start_codon:yes stop_codon:yes gene_type:complete